MTYHNAVGVDHPDRYLPGTLKHPIGQQHDDLLPVEALEETYVLQPHPSRYTVYGRLHLGDLPDKVIGHDVGHYDAVHTAECLQELADTHARHIVGDQITVSMDGFRTDRDAYRQTM